MGHDEVREIAKIVGGDKYYVHFSRRINKEFEASDEQRNSSVYVLFEEEKGRKIGFSVIGYSPAKMNVWKNVLSEEGWVDDQFEMISEPFELMYMYIRPEFRGKGRGSKLFKRVLAFARKRGVDEIYSYVSDRNPNALNFYKKMNTEVLKDLSDEGITSAFLRWKVA